MVLYLHPPTQAVRALQRLRPKLIGFDLIAQLVEHLPFKEVVLGSSPSQVTKS